MRPTSVPAIDTLVGFRDIRQVYNVPSAKDQGVRHPAEYMFKDIPADLDDLPFKPDVWPKFLYDNAARVLGLAPRVD